MKKPTTFLLSRLMLLVGLLMLCLVAPTQAQTLSIGIDFPRYNSSYIAGSTINIRTSATAAMGTSVAKVEYFYMDYYDGNYQKIGEDLTAPYSYTWTIPTPTGAEWYYQIRAVVTDAQGNTATANDIYGGYYNIAVYRPDYTGSRNWYINAASTATNPNGTEAAPYTTIRQVTERITPGDTVFVMGGTYQNGEVQLFRTGLPNKWIVFMPYKNDKPIFRTTQNDYNGFGITPASAYLKIQGFEIIGNNANVNVADAKAQPGGCQDPNGNPGPKFNDNGIGIDGRNGGPSRPHHITIANNIVHDCGAGGIGALEADYVTIENNTVYNNSWYTIYGTSGISVFHPWNYDNSTADYRNKIRNNTVYGNRLFVPWKDGGCRISDGNGIILDDFLNTQTSSTIQNQVYTGRTLVANNLIYKNGGSGIITFQGVNIDVINNTAYQNSQSAEPIGEVFSYTSQNVNFINNIIRPITGETTFFPTSNTAVTYSKNLYIVDNPASQIPTTQEGGATVVDNLTLTTASETTVFENPSLDSTKANFNLKLGSLAINAGSAAYTTAVPTDIVGVQRPQGNGVDIGAYEFKGQPIAFTQQPVSGSAVCVGASVSASVSVSGPVTSYQWYKDGPSGGPVALTNVTSATTATLLLTSVTTAQQGRYSVVVTGFNSLTSTPFNLTVTSPPPAPNASSLTATVGATNVALTVTNCTGTISWNGIDGTASLPISTTAAGTFSYSAVCKAGSCISPVTVVTATISPAVPGGKLSVYYRDGDNNQPANNSIRPYLKLYNDGTTAVPYGDLTVRYWLTVENFSPLTNLSVYWAELGTNKVKLKYVALPQPRQGAFGYVEYSFSPSAGNLAGSSNSGEIQTGIGKQNWTNFNEADDFSFAPNAAYSQTSRITLYRNGALIWGTEPATVAPVTAVKVYSENKNSSPTGNQISTYLNVANAGNVPVDYSQLTVRYWFTADGDKPLVYSLDYAELGNNSIKNKFVKVNRSGADTYLELSFANSLGQFYPASSTGLIQQRVNKSDWSAFNEANDYSYKVAAPLAENLKITAYLNGTLVYGQEPGSSSGRIGVSETTMQVRVLGNPVLGDKVDVAVSGVDGQPLRLQLTDIQGRIVSEYQTSQAAAVEQHQLLVGQQSGMLLLQISTPGERQTIKLLKP